MNASLNNQEILWCNILIFLVLTDTKLDDTFPTAQFLVRDFSEPYRLGRNRNGGGVYGLNS